MILHSVQKQFLDSTSLLAEQAGHIFPTMAACEAALESDYGCSLLAREGANLFGEKQHQTPIYDTLILPTHEFINHKWIVVEAKWVKYPSYRECFQDRMATLQRLSHLYIHYVNALETTDPIVYITEVSKTWSTDPHRAAKVISIHEAYLNE